MHWSTAAALWTLLLAVCASHAANVKCGTSGTSCFANHTCCGAAFSGNGMGCCPYPDAVCCSNHQSCCPAGFECKEDGPYYATCVKSGQSQAGLSVCKPGPALPPSSGLNCLVLGDSVSIGYTPFLTKALSSVCKVQHTPWDTRDGGAEETAYGEQCLDYFLRSPDLSSFPADLIVFNWGLHNIAQPGSVVPGQSGTPQQYAGPFKNIVRRLRATQAKLLYATTTPVPWNATLDGTVRGLNVEALQIIGDIPHVDLHAAVIAKCGPPVYNNCSISLNKPGHPNPHYNAAGYEYLTSFLAPAVKKMLQ